MPMLPARLICSFVLFTAPAVWAQQMISVRSGLIHYTEGSVTVDGKQVENKNSEFSSLLTNQELQTGEGRAELLLTPGSFLRVGEHSRIRMASTALSNTQVEVLEGSSVVEVTELLKENAIAILSHGAMLQIEKAGIYRIDSDPARFRVYDGLAFYSQGSSRMNLTKGKEVALDADTVASAKSFDTKDADDLYRWSARRSSYVAMANVALAKSASMSNGYSNGLLGGGFGGGYGGGCYSGCWGFNQAFGMYSYLPFDNFAFSPFGYAFWSPYSYFYAPYYYYPGGSYPTISSPLRPVSPTRGLPVALGGRSSGGYTQSLATVRSNSGFNSGSRGGGFSSGNSGGGLSSAGSGGGFSRGGGGAISGGGGGMSGGGHGGGGHR